MLRLSDKGVPPHMVHLYDHKKHGDTPTQTRLSVILDMGARLIPPFSKLKQKKPDPTMQPPLSATSEENPNQEQQYLGAVEKRDTRWKPS